MEEIKAGEYFRCKKYGRINKYIDSFYDGSYFNVNCEPNYTFVYHSKEDFISSIEHSKDITDLIEVGDIVKVYVFADISDDDSEAVETYYRIESKYEITELKESVKMNYAKILSILTHEMYEQNCYEIGE